MQCLRLHSRHWRAPCGQSPARAACEPSCWGWQTAGCPRSWLPAASACLLCPVGPAADHSEVAGWLSQCKPYLNCSMSSGSQWSKTVRFMLSGDKPCEPDSASCIASCDQHGLSRAGTCARAQQSADPPPQLAHACQVTYHALSRTCTTDLWVESAMLQHDPSAIMTPAANFHMSCSMLPWPHGILELHTYTAG